MPILTTNPRFVPVEPGFSPDDLANLALWIDASDTTSITHAAGLVTQIDDLSGAARHFTASGSARPTTGTVTVNGLNALDFDGSANVLTGPILLAAETNFTMFVVIKPDAAPSASTVPFWNGRGNDGQGYGPAIATNTSKLGYGTHGFNWFSGGVSSPSSGTHVLSLDRATTTWTMRSDGVAQVLSTTAGNSAGSNSYIGGIQATGGVYFNGAICEALFYTAQLSYADRQLVEGYFATKWGTPTPVAPITDAFNRADNAFTMGNTDTGQTWAYPQGVWGITSNKGFCNSGSGHDTANVESTVADCTTQVTLTLPSLLTAGVCVRVTDQSNMFITTSSGLWKKEAGSFSLIGSTGTQADGDVIDVLTSGSSFTVRRNGGTVLTGNSSFNQTATKHGLYDQSANSARFDDFSVAV